MDDSFSLQLGEHLTKAFAIERWNHDSLNNSRIIFYTDFTVAAYTGGGEAALQQAYNLLEKFGAEEDPAGPNPVIVNDARKMCKEVIQFCAAQGIPLHPPIVN